MFTVTTYNSDLNEVIPFTSVFRSVELAADAVQMNEVALRCEDEYSEEADEIKASTFKAFVESDYLEELEIPGGQFTIIFNDTTYIITHCEYQSHQR